MKIFLNLLLILFIGFASDSFSQIPRHMGAYTSFYYDYKLINPALAGSKARHLANVVHSGYPETSYNNWTYGSYELSTTNQYHGFGGIFSVERSKYFDIKTFNAMYSHRFNIGDDSGFRVGANVSYEDGEYKESFFQYQDASDPLIIYNTRTTNDINFNLGVVYYSDIVNIGVAVNNIINSDFQNRTMNFLVSRKVSVAGGKFKIEPSVFYLQDFGGRDFLKINSTFEAWHWLLFGIGYWSSDDGAEDYSYNIGFNIRDRVQLITHVYSSFNEKFKEFSGRGAEAILRVTIPHKK